MAPAIPHRLVAFGHAGAGSFVFVGRPVVVRPATTLPKCYQAPQPAGTIKLNELQDNHFLG